MVSLERWREEILSQEERAAAARPKSAAQILRQKLEAAIAAEEFEEAARLRDQIRKLGEERKKSVRKVAGVPFTVSLAGYSTAWLSFAQMTPVGQ